MQTSESTPTTSRVSLADEPIWNQIRVEREGALSIGLQYTGLNVPTPYDKQDPRYIVDTNSYGVDLGDFVETYGTEDEARTAAKQQDKPFVVKDGDDPLADFLEED